MSFESNCVRVVIKVAINKFGISNRMKERFWPYSAGKGFDPISKKYSLSSSFPLSALLVF